jgi:hypothetical protein
MGDPNSGSCGNGKRAEGGAVGELTTVSGWRTGARVSGESCSTGTGVEGRVAASRPAASTRRSRALGPKDNEETGETTSKSPSERLSLGGGVVNAGTEENREKDTGKVGKRPGICETVQMSRLTTGSERVKGTGGYTERSGGYTTEGCMRLGSRHTRRGEEFQKVENNGDRMNPAFRERWESRG